jgi:ribonuclease HI
MESMRGMNRSPTSPMNGDNDQSQNSATFGERFEFEGQKYILVAELQQGFVLAVKAEDESPAPTCLLPSPWAKPISAQQEVIVQESGLGVASIWTDGSCLGNPGPGGWAYVRQDGEGTLAVASGGEPETTGNRMEIRAAIEALKALPNRQMPVVLYSDSQLLIRAMAEGWKRQANLDLWEQLDRVAARLDITWRWVRGHSGQPENERCNRLAETAAIHQAKGGGASLMK